jgi:hypothetical protein
MVIGLARGNSDPQDMNTKLAAYQIVRDFNTAFEDIYGTSVCSLLLEKHASKTEVTERKHHNLICRKAVGDAAAILYQMLIAR